MRGQLCAKGAKEQSRFGYINQGSQESDAEAWSHAAKAPTPSFPTLILYGPLNDAGGDDGRFVFMRI